MLSHGRTWCLTAKNSDIRRGQNMAERTKTLVAIRDAYAHAPFAVPAEAAGPAQRDKRSTAV
jgi:hypothetical protein